MQRVALLRGPRQPMTTPARTQHRKSDIVTQKYFDRREMLMLHDMFRREFGLMPGLVRRVDVGDRDRPEIIAAHIRGVSAILHHHHVGEDAHNWPVLLERCADKVAPLVELMESQHEAVAQLGRGVDEALVRWTAEPSAGSREALAVALDALLPALKEHLAAEEQHVVPLMEQHITAAEWNEMVRKGSADVDQKSLPLSFGMLMYEGDPEIVDAAIAGVSANLSPEAGASIRKLAMEAFAAHSELIHGTTTPPRSSEL
jgi:iron-sulfur cluster repair protein YtfE (RIC family)